MASTKAPAKKKAYGKKAADKVGAAIHEMKEGKLRSGSSGKIVTSRKQAVAIGLSEARQEGGKVPAPKRSASPSTAKTKKKPRAKRRAARA